MKPKNKKRNYCPICSGYISSPATTCGQIECKLKNGEEIVWKRGINTPNEEMIGITYNIKISE